MMLVDTGSYMLWLLLGLAGGALLSGGMAIYAKRQMKRALYYFPLRQAERRWQTYTLTTALMTMLACSLGLYLWISVQEPEVETAAMVTETLTVEPTNVPTRVVTQTPLPQPTREQSNISSIVVPTPTPSLDLPPSYDTLTPNSALSDATTISELRFATSVDANYAPINPRVMFPDGTEVMYATFDYDGMADGMTWTWLWRYEGRVIEGDHEIWAYGDDGPGYMFVSPEEGLPEGRYSAEIWVNGELFQRAAVQLGEATTAETESEIEIADRIPLPTESAWQVQDEPALAVLPSFYGAAVSADGLLPDVPVEAQPVEEQLGIDIAPPEYMSPPFVSASLPAQFNQHEAAREMLETTNARIVRLSADIIPNGNSTIFALSSTIFHSDLLDGMEWAVVWRLNNDIIGGETKLWQGETNQVEYLNLNPKSGVLGGTYSLEIWINETLFSRAIIDVTPTP